jgi:hypothetical protein
MRRRFVRHPVHAVLLAALALGGLETTPALASHGNWGSLGPALRPCPAGPPGTGGRDLRGMCEDPSAQSDCERDPATALRLGQNGRTRFVLRPRDVTIARQAAEEYSYFSVRGVETCAGARWAGDAEVSLLVRLTVKDPACAGGSCTVPDTELSYPLPCRNGYCRARLHGAQGSVLPRTQPWSTELLAIRMLDPAGQPLFSPTMTLGRTPDELPYRFPLGAAEFEGRLVQAFEPCAPGAATKRTAGGLAACVARPRSDCASAPATALRPEPRARRSKVALSVARQALRTGGRILDLVDCAGRPYEGPVTLAVAVRATVEDGASGGLCSSFDTELRSTLTVRDGRTVLREVLPLEVSGGNVIGAELVRIEVRDPAGRAVLVAPGFNVVCNASRCYGN